jgi:riboflavin biosynthesis pyrimidine reductase
MQQIWPPPVAEGLAELEPTDLRERYGYGDRPARAHVRVNFVMTANGTVTLDGLSAGISTPADMLVFGALRELADVILVGAGTARAEGYGGARGSEAYRQRRRERGQADVPPIAVVSARADLDPGGPLFTDTRVPPIIVTTGKAPEARVASLVDAGARVYVAGAERVEVPLLLDALTGAGLTRVLCEGGPRLFGHLVREDAVDELFLTVTPGLVGGHDFIYNGPLTGLLPLELVSVLVDDGALFLRYRRDRPGRAHRIGRPPKPD